ncbi:ABC transporter ATP-binding protein, partial [Rubrivirga sp.]|uniref:ABC transporter ATP-binding protein n=1 Tax=Rubrivirga sp. TaxID=1885344 RepID=UPI003C707233
RGPSGAGKTVLLRALAGLDALDEGALESRQSSVANADGAVRDLPRHRASAALVAQRPALFDGTVRDNLEAAFGYAVHTSAYDDERARHLLGQLGRDPDVLDQRVDGLSGGEAQTVGLVRALVTDPTVLLLDEPTAGLDPERTAALEAVVAAFLEGGDRAVVWTGHDAAQIARVTDRALDL